MIIRAILTAFCVTAVIFASAGSAAHGPTEIVKRNFEQTIPNLPGKPLVALEVEYPPGAASGLTSTLSPLSFTRTWYQAQSNQR